MITIVGSLNLDLVVRVARLPAAGETLLATGYAEHPGGKGANQAVAAARAGGRVRMVGRVGTDAAGAELVDGLAREGIDVRDVGTVDAATGRAFIEVDASGQNHIVVVAGANAAWGPDDLPGELVSPAGVLVLQLEVPIEVVAAATKSAAAAGAHVVLNLAPAQRLAADVLACVDTLVVNQSEAAFALNRTLAEVDDDVEAAVADLAAKLHGDAVLTLGADGAVFAGRSGSGRVRGFPAEVVDTTAAGDAFVGALATRLAAGDALSDAIRFACAAGAVAVSRDGAQPSLPRHDEIARLSRGPR